MKNLEHNKKLVSILVLISFAITIAINLLANVLPINNMTTGQVSEVYKNLFTPIGFTFSIWFVIYLLLGVYSIYQFNFNSRRPDNNDRVVRKVNLYFILSNIANALWIISWHYRLIFLSVVLMLVILGMLISIRINISHRSSLSKSEKINMELPFSVYFAWISVATIANITTYLVDINWDRFGYEESTVTVIILIVGLLISIATIIRFNDIPYGVVIIWAYSGILYKHISPDYFAKSYTNIMLTLIVSIILIFISCIMVILRNKPRRRRRRR